MRSYKSPIPLKCEMCGKKLTNARCVSKQYCDECIKIRKKTYYRRKYLKNGHQYFVKEKPKRFRQCGELP